MKDKEKPKSLRKPLSPYELATGTYGDFMKVIEKKRNSEAEESDVKIPNESIPQVNTESDSSSQRPARVKKIETE